MIEHNKDLLTEEMTLNFGTQYLSPMVYIDQFLPYSDRLDYL
nr:hypothetical protein [Clostridium beijerinckii]